MYAITTTAASIAANVTVIAGIRLKIVPSFGFRVWSSGFWSAGLRTAGKYAGASSGFCLFGFCLLLGMMMVGGIATCLTCCLAALPYVGTVILLPVFVCLRAFGLRFIRQFGPEYDVWATIAHATPTTPPEPPPQG